RARPARPLRSADRDGGSLPAGRGRYVLFRAWRQPLPEAGSGWPHYGDRFHSQPHGHHDGSRVRGPRHFLPDVGAFPACGVRRAGTRATAQDAAGGIYRADRWGAGMMTGRGENEAAGGPARHIPVMLREVLDALQPQTGQLIVDGTFGAGGYTRAILEAGANVVAIDRDPNAIAAGRAMEREFDGRLRLVHGQFSKLDEVAEGQLDGVVLDIGVSSMQLDEAERGFSFRNDGPLDMRMAQIGPSAADVVNRFKASDLTRIIGIYGEERHAGRVARMIEKRRAERPFERTKDLAEAIAAVVGHNPREKIHPATRAFQGLRIFVNDELGELSRALFAAERALKPGGRLVVVTFHS